ncbi:MAG: aldose epimerase family protein, partial [Ginsengibacter sp.]
MKQYILFLLTMSICTNIACNDSTSETEESQGPDSLKAGITTSDWGNIDGKKVSLFTLTNEAGNKVTITNYGGIVTSFVTHDKNGIASSIIIGFDSLNQYLQKPPYFGALIGRYGNRIGNAKFTLDGKVYQLAANDGKNTLHGGLAGFDKVIWDASVTDTSAPALTLHYVSKDEEEGYPGNLDVTVKYTLTNDAELKIEYNAQTDKATPVNLTNHSYFNLTGDVSHSILDHTL